MAGALTNLSERLRDPRDVLAAIGLFLVGKMQSTFRDQGRGPIRWLGRHVPNRFGVLTDLKEGRTPPERRWDSRPAGIDTGRLRSSLAFRVEGDKVVVGSNLPYASDVQQGGTSSIDLDADLRQKLGKWLKSLSGDRQKTARESFGFAFHEGQYTITTPPRPFVFVSPEDRREVDKLTRSLLLGGS